MPARCASFFRRRHSDRERDFTGDRERPTTLLPQFPHPSFVNEGSGDGGHQTARVPGRRHELRNMTACARASSCRRGSARRSLKYGVTPIGVAQHDDGFGHPSAHWLPAIISHAFAAGDAVLAMPMTGCAAQGHSSATISQGLTSARRPKPGARTAGTASKPIPIESASQGTSRPSLAGSSGRSRAAQMIGLTTL